MELSAVKVDMGVNAGVVREADPSDTIGYGGSCVCVFAFQSGAAAVSVSN